MQEIIPFRNCIHLNLPKVLIGGIVTGVILSETECDVEYVKVDNVCVDVCDGINCGSGGDCLNGICSCRTGYVNVENYCEETCELSPCKELIKKPKK